MTRQLEREAGLEPAATEQRPAEDASAGNQKKQKKGKKTARAGQVQRDRGRASGTEDARRQRTERGDTSQLVERKRQQREARMRRNALRRVALLFGMAVLLAAVVMGGRAALHSRLFAVTSIQVNGAKLLTQSEVTTLAAVPPESSTPLLNTRQIEKNLEACVWISKAQVRRKLPHQITITVTERSPLAAVSTDAGSWLIARDLWWLGAYSDTTGVVTAARKGALSVTLPQDARAGIVPITDVENPRPAPGRATSNGAVKNALAALLGISPELRAQVKSISAPSVVGTTLYLKNGVEIDFGSAAQCADKDTVIRKILAEQGDTVVLINVRTVDKATWRGLNTSE